MLAPREHWPEPLRPRVIHTHDTAAAGLHGIKGASPNVHSSVIRRLTLLGSSCQRNNFRLRKHLTEIKCRTKKMAAQAKGEELNELALVGPCRRAFEAGAASA